MSQPLPSYPDYKPAGLPWLAEVPAHWEVTRLKTVSRFITSGSRGWAEFYSETGPVFLRIGNLSVHSIDLRLDKIQRVQPPAGAEGERTKVVANDLLISITALLGAIGVVPNSIEEAYVNQHTALVKLRLDEIHPRWAAYCLYSPVGKHQFRMLTNGGTKEGLTLGDVSCLSLLLPPLPEQQRIVAFLDGKTRQIARLLQHKRQLIKLLNEQRQNVIQRAVLYGINPDVRLKPSGVEWFTEVPAHWSVKKLKHLATVRSGIAKGKVYLVGEELVQVSYLRVANVQDGYLNLTDVATIQVTKAEAQSYKLEPFDLLMNEGGDIDKLGRGTVWHGEIENCIHQNHVFALRPKPKTNVYFLNYFVGAPACKKYFQLKGKQTTNLASISSSAIAATPIALPPAEEQQAIVDYIEKETKIIDQTIARAQREIELIQEYRTRLIADVVTGRVDVRHLAAVASLPELPAEPELEDEEESEEELLIETEDGRD